MTNTVRATKTASDLKLGDWVHADDLDKHLEGVAEVLFAQPFNEYGTTGVTILLGFGEMAQPQPVAPRLGRTVRIASAEEVASAKAKAQREQVAEGLRALALLVQEGTVPLKSGRLSMNENAGDVDALAAIGAALGIDVHEGYDRYRSVEWPKGHEVYQPGVHVTWFAYAPKDPDVDETGLGYSREVADDPAPVSPARVPLLVGGAESRIAEDGRREDYETPVPVREREPVTWHFSFGHGQTDPDTGENLLDKYVTVVAPTYEACRDAMFASRYGNKWSFDYDPDSPTWLKWGPTWTEHERIDATAREASA